MIVRWPLRNQVLVPMGCLMICALAGVSAINAYLSLQRTRSQIAHDLRQLAITLSAANFPLTNAVLQKMRALSGADFVLTAPTGRALSSTLSQEALDGLPRELPASGTPGKILGKPIAVGGREFFHAPIQVRSSPEGRSDAVLHILYAKETYDKAWRESVYPPVLLGVLAVLLVGVVGSGIASRVTRPLRKLQSQVDEIAEGNFRPLPAPQRDDELADLTRCIDRMSSMLSRYEDRVRHHEQLRTLGQLGGGLAHQLRNSVTGCRMAVELHARQCPSEAGDETLQVAMRQLMLMERYLQRFLALGRQERGPHGALDARCVVENVVGLVDASARHMDVALSCVLPPEPVLVFGNQDALEEMLTNVTINAIEAAACIRGETGRPASPPAREEPERRAVQLTLRLVDDSVRLEIEDTGPGPSQELSESLFEPFVTDKPDGTGLGLAVAQEIAVSHVGRIRWERGAGSTRFVVDLPVWEPETDGGQTVDR